MKVLLTPVVATVCEPDRHTHGRCAFAVSLRVRDVPLAPLARLRRPSCREMAKPLAAIFAVQSGGNFH